MSNSTQALLNKRYKDRSGYVYIVHAVGTSRYKIGRTSNLKNRIEQLNRGQTAFPVKLIEFAWSPDCIFLEKRLHEKFIDNRSCGEWFDFIEDDYFQVSCILKFNRFDLEELAFLLTEKYIHYFHKEHVACSIYAMSAASFNFKLDLGQANSIEELALILDYLIKHLPEQNFFENSIRLWSLRLDSDYDHNLDMHFRFFLMEMSACCRSFLHGLRMGKGNY